MDTESGYNINAQAMLLVNSKDKHRQGVYKPLISLSYRGIRIQTSCPCCSHWFYVDRAGRFSQSVSIRLFLHMVGNAWNLTPSVPPSINRAPAYPCQIKRLRQAFSHVSQRRPNNRLCSTMDCFPGRAG